MRFSSAGSHELHASASASGIRVVLLERDLDVRRRLQNLLEADHLFTVAGSAESWPQCEVLLDEYVPELLVVGSRQSPVDVVFSQSGFPMILALDSACHDCHRATGSMECGHLQEALTAVANEIYLRKVNQLSSLLDHYFAGVASFSYVRTLTVEEGGQALEVPAERVSMLEASGNYVRVYVSDQIYQLRETISGMASRLDPSIFLRVHRSYIVNIRHVHLSQREGMASQLLLGSGQTIPIGPNYRADVSRMLEDRPQLMAG